MRNSKQQNVSMKTHVQEKYNKPGRIPHGRCNLYAKKRRCIHFEKQTKKDPNRFVISDILRGPSQLFQTLKLIDDQETENSLFCMSSCLLNSMNFRRELLAHPDLPHRTQTPRRKVLIPEKV